MSKRFLSIWFRHLKTDWFTRRQTDLKKVPFVLIAPDHGRIIITAANQVAIHEGIEIGMVEADARIIIPSLITKNDVPGFENKVLKSFAEWFIRYSPVVTIDAPDGLILDITGCAHLWKGEEKYIENIVKRLNEFGYTAYITIADTIGSAWAIARFEKNKLIVNPSDHVPAILSLPPEALRIESTTVERLHKLGLKTISQFINMPRSVLRRRFGQQFINRLDQAKGVIEENIIPMKPIEPYSERLTCLEPIVTANGIEIAIKSLLNTLCGRLRKENKGLRSATLFSYRIDGEIEKIEIGTNRPSCNSDHLFKLFELKITTIEPALGIELFVLQANKVEDAWNNQEKLWTTNLGLDNNALAELLDRVAGKFGTNKIHRYLPAEHHWPEWSFKTATTLKEQTTAKWNIKRPRPLKLLAKPEPIEVTAPIPDYPPMIFHYKKKLHKIIKADGPERIEQEWWLQFGQHRDYYCVEDSEGHRYWLFRLGHYHDRSYQWFIHGFFV